MRAVLVLLLFLPTFAFAQAEISPASPYADAVRRLDRFIAREVEQKRLPALSIALVDDQRIVWARGYGHANPSRKTPATADTVYRVGSVSKLFTDLAVMQLVEKKQLDLDAPITTYLPDFQPRRPAGWTKPITLRQLMAHRSGLVREPRIGNYFDPDNSDLGKTVACLNDSTLVYEPESRMKYSNAGIAVVGRVLERTSKLPFPEVLRRSLLDPLKMSASSFEPTPAITARLARAIMWTYEGREFPAPTFELGMSPAGSLYSTVLDLSRFLRMLFARGELDGVRILKADTLESMWSPQFVKPDTREGFGLGFSVTRWKDRRRIGHNGAIYGFATDLSALPDDKLGVIVVNSRDCANAVSSRIAEVALAHLLAVRLKQPLPPIEETSPLEPGEALRLAGRYASKSAAFDLVASAGRLYYFPARGGVRVELRRLGKDLVFDDPLGWGTRLIPDADGFRLGKDLFRRLPPAKPDDIPARWRGLIGEYGWDHNKLLILEKDGKLHALIEWVFLYPLTEEADDRFRFPPDFGLYHGESLQFRRDKQGRAVEVVAAGIHFTRRTLDGEDGRTFRIKPQRPVADLRREAARATPPEEPGILFRKSELVELNKLDPSLRLDIRYATSNNFLGTPVYQSARAYLQKPAAEALVRVHRRLEKEGYGLLIHDGYRPWAVTKIFWEATPAHLRTFVANPADGSRHNRGCAVDLTLFDRRTGKVIDMVGGYDEMSDRAYSDYPGGTSLQRWHRLLLRNAMQAEGFTVLPEEWWHFDYRDWRKYPLANEPFEKLTP